MILLPTAGGVGGHEPSPSGEKEEPKSETGDISRETNDETDVLDLSGDTDLFQIYTKADAAERVEMFRKSIPKAIREMYEDMEADGSDTSAGSDASASDATPVLSERDAQSSVVNAIAGPRTSYPRQEQAISLSCDVLMVTLGDGNMDEYEDVEVVLYYAQETFNPGECGDGVGLGYFDDVVGLASVSVVTAKKSEYWLHRSPAKEDVIDDHAETGTFTLMDPKSCLKE